MSTRSHPRLNARSASRFQSRIAELFSGNAFSRPLFYRYPGGLRFELSVGGSAIEQFLTAHQKASLICADLFADELPVVCLRYCYRHAPAHVRAVIRELMDAGIKFPREREFWTEALSPEERLEDDPDAHWCNVAFQLPPRLLPNLLWCALARDLPIRPKALCDVYLFALDAKIVAYPYDDRGMDVVGPNHEKLAELYQKHKALLLDYDRAKMIANFESGVQQYD